MPKHEPEYTNSPPPREGMDEPTRIFIDMGSMLVGCDPTAAIAAVGFLVGRILSVSTPELRVRLQDVFSLNLERGAATL